MTITVEVRTNKNSAEVEVTQPLANTSTTKVIVPNSSWDFFIRGDQYLIVREMREGESVEPEVQPVAPY